MHNFFSYLATESGVFLLRFSDSKPGQIAISYTDYDTNTNNNQDSNQNQNQSDVEKNKIAVYHCLVDVGMDSLSLELLSSKSSNSEKNKNSTSTSTSNSNSNSNSNSRKYDSLKHLLIYCKKLKYFYPHVPKGIAFEFVDRLQEKLQNADT